MSWLSVIVVLSGVGAADHHWSCDPADAANLIIHGELRRGRGVVGDALMFDGGTVAVVPDSADAAQGDSGFSIVAWFCPFLVDGQQQMIVAKNRYGLDERQWGVMIDSDNRIRLYVWQDRWVTIAAEAPPVVGEWQCVGITIRPDRAALWVNGEPVGDVSLAQPIPRTGAPVTFGAVDDNGRIRQTLCGVIDEVRLCETPLEDAQMASLYRPVTGTLAIPPFAWRMDVEPDPAWSDRIRRHAAQDRTTVIFDGRSPDKLACDTTLRRLPDGSLVMIMLGGGDTEPLPQNRVFLSRSDDGGVSWSPMQPLDLGIKAASPETALVPSELMVRGGRCTLFVATHDGGFGDWKEWMTHSDDQCRTWSRLEPVPGRLHHRTFIRNHIVTRDGRILLPFQHYLASAEPRDISGGRRFSPPTNPRNGVLMSDDGGRTWSEHGDIRISPRDDYHGWAENNIVELSDGRIAMLIRADGLGGVLYYAESTDGGRTWPAFARRTAIPNPGSKATLYSLGGDSVALLHNPNPAHRSPLALWVSFDGMRSWPYQRILVPESVDGPRGRLNYPDGVVSEDGRWLHFAFDDNRHRAVSVTARLPDRDDGPQTLPLTGTAPDGTSVMLDLPQSGADPNPIDYDTLPRVSGEPTVISDVRDQAGRRVHQHAYLARFGEQFWAMWSDGPGVPRPGVSAEQHRNVVPGHDQAGTRVSYAVSSDGRDWSEPRDLSGPPRDPEFGWIARGFWLRDGELLALASHFHAPGYPGPGLSLEAFRWNAVTGRWDEHGTVLDDTLNNFPPRRLPSGPWMMTRRDHRRQVSVMIGGVDAFDQWSVRPLASWDDSARPEEPYWYVLPDDRTLVGLIRDNGGSKRLLRTFSTDGGQTWSPLQRTNFPDATSKFFVLKTSRGDYVMVSNANPRRRDPLTVAVSSDGLVFTDLLYLVGGRHVDYPHLIEHDGQLLIAFSGAKQTMEVVRVSLDDLDAITRRSAADVSAADRKPSD